MQRERESEKRHRWHDARHERFAPLPVAMTDSPLRRHYEDPATPLSSGSQRAVLQAELLARAVGVSTRPLVVVDLGCGDGAATAVAIERCRLVPGAQVKVLGLDWSSRALERARARGVVVARAALGGAGLPLASASVDVVVMSELIEHLVDTDGALEEAARVLVPGGTLLLSTPNLAAWYNRVLLAVGVQPVFTEVSLRGVFGRPGHVVAGHLRIFTRRALEEVLVSRGFEAIEITGAPFHDVPRPLRPVDRAFCRTPGLASILLACAKKPS